MECVSGYKIVNISSMMVVYAVLGKYVCTLFLPILILWKGFHQDYPVVVVEFLEIGKQVSVKSRRKAQIHTESLKFSIPSIVNSSELST